MKILLLLCLALSGLLFGQNLLSAPSIPKEVEKVSTATICYDFPDHEAYFQNGMKAFTKKIENYITLESVKVKKDEKILTAMLNFIVERDGSIIEIQVLGSNVSFNKSVEKATKHINGKWIPTKQNGYFVRSKVQIPLSMNLK